MHDINKKNMTNTMQIPAEDSLFKDWVENRLSQ